MIFQTAKMAKAFPIKTFFSLGRLDKPVGIWLLWAPTAWALWLAGRPDFRVVALFFLGTIIMRTAGCVINDIADRDIDIHVQRTKERPLTSGRLSLVQSLSFLLILLVFALAIVIQLPKFCFYYALIALCIVFIYPFCKRFLHGPQLILGIAFSLGIPMAYVAEGQAPNRMTLLLMLINFLWTVAYDTEYALADKEDDVLIGVRSTAIWFGRHAQTIIGLLQVSTHSLWLILAKMLMFSSSFYLIWFIAGCLFIYQHFLLAERSPKAYTQAFLSNTWYGLLLWLALVIA